MPRGTDGLVDTQKWRRILLLSTFPFNLVVIITEFKVFQKKIKRNATPIIKTNYIWCVNTKENKLHLVCEIKGEQMHSCLLLSLLSSDSKSGQSSSLM